MGILTNRRKLATHRLRGPALPTSSRGAAPKNGPLTLALIGSILLMIVLGVLNIRLISDPSVAVKAFGPSVPSTPAPPSPPRACAVSPDSKKQAQPNPPQVTFYSKLKVQEAPRPEPSDPGPDGSSETDDGTSSGKASAQAAHRETLSSFNRPAGASKPPGRPNAQLKLPMGARGKKRYTVQVGAFSDPGVAKEWSLKWKARGYAVKLKPVARPRTGVIYRLYLGDFSSKKKADRLVKRLKVREGVTAFPVVVRN